MYKFGKTSKQRLSTCHPDLILIMEEALKLSFVDFGIAQGYRTIEEQQKFFKEGKSKIDGINKKSKHNYNPSMAVDIFAYYNGKAQWDVSHLSFLGGLITGVAMRLKQENKISHTIRWGGNWDSDGIIISDQTFQDLPHFELI